MVAAGITLYNPDEERLYDNLLAASGQTDRLILVDNASRGGEELKERVFEWLGEKPPVWIRNEKNLGVAGALRQIMDEAGRLGAEWVLTLDQDSQCAPGLVERCLACAAGLPDAGILTCRILDRNADSARELELWGREAQDGAGPEELPSCITSGSLMNMAAYRDSDGFDERLFIDAVDNDICLNLRKHGYRIYRVPFYGLMHEVGRARKIRLFGREDAAYNHEPWRNFYMARNFWLLHRKYPDEVSLSHAVLYEGWRELIILLYEKQKGKKLASRWKGLAAARSIPAER